MRGGWVVTGGGGGGEGEQIKTRCWKNKVRVSSIIQ